MFRAARTPSPVLERPALPPEHVPLPHAGTIAKPVIEVANLSRSFDDKLVVDSVSLQVPSGNLCGVIGPSGCGKTTLVRLLLGLLRPTSGEVRVLGADPTRFTTRHREQIGYTPQGFFLYPNLTVIENARFVAGLYGMGLFRRRRRIREVLQFLEIWDARRRLARDISGGMQRRLELACALLHRPTLLFVDEPTAGLDPVLRSKIWDHLRALCEQGATVLVTTQYIDEAEYCDTVAVLHQGRLAATGSPDELRRRVLEGEDLEIEAELSRADLIAVLSLDGVQSARREGAGTVLLTVDEAASTAPRVTATLQRRGVHVAAIRPRVPSFEEVFMKIVGEHG